MRQRSGTTLVEALPALDPTDIRGGPLVDPAEAHRGHGRGGRRDGASALLRPDPGVRGRAVEVGLQAVVGRRATITSPMGLAWSNT
jgi:hypothetical protein